MVKVSIIMGVFNAEDTIERTLNSIFHQTYTDFELIICNDCSTDSTSNILSKWYDEHPDQIIIIENNENSKLAASLNKCLAKASGEYIARIDADDYMYESRLAEQVKFMNTHSNIDCLGTSVDIYNGDIYRNTDHSVENPTLSTLTAGGYPFFHPTVMIKTNVLRKLNGYCEEPSCYRCEDLDLWYRFFIMGFKGYNIQMPLIKYSITIDDYKKRNVANAVKAIAVRNNYRKLLNLPWYSSIRYYKSALYALLPSNVRFNIDSKKDTRKIQ